MTVEPATPGDTRSARRFSAAWLPAALPWMIVAGLVCLSALAGWREYRLQLELHVADFEDRVSTEAQRLRRDLQVRESIALMAVRTFDPVYALDPDLLAPFARRLLPQMPNVYSVVWAPRISEREVDGVLRLIGRVEPLAAPGATNSAPSGDDGDRFLVLDIQPRTDANISSRGLILNSVPAPAAAIRRR